MPLSVYYLGSSQLETKKKRTLVVVGKRAEPSPENEGKTVSWNDEIRSGPNSDRTWADVVQSGQLPVQKAPGPITTTRNEVTGIRRHSATPLNNDE